MHLLERTTIQCVWFSTSHFASTYLPRMNPSTPKHGLLAIVSMSTQITIHTKIRKMDTQRRWVHKFIIIHQIHYGLLTYWRRFWALSEFLKELFFIPLTISSNNTPKLKTSDLTENLPRMAYSGAMYPLPIINNKLFNLPLSSVLFFLCWCVFLVQISIIYMFTLTMSQQLCQCFLLFGLLPKALPCQSPKF